MRVDVNQLVDQLRDGDDSAGPILVSMVAPRLLGYAAVIASDIPSVDRELVVEQAIEKAIDRIDRYDPGRGTFVGWIRGFVRYGIADWRRGQPGVRAELPDELPDAATSAEGNLAELDDVDQDTHARSAALASLVLTLDESDQLLLQLRFVEQLPHGVIAERLGVTEAACRKRLQRVLARLRERAADDPDFRDYIEGDES